MNNLIKNSVLPMKNDAIERAVEYANEMIKKVHEKLSSYDWDMNVFYKNETRENWKLAISICKPEQCCTKANEPSIYNTDCESENRFINQTKEMAAFEYDKFVCKLESKIGSDVVSADIKGNHVFDYSVLTITRSNDDIEFWKTRMIINTSKLGKVFNQFPTRKVKKA